MAEQGVRRKVSLQNPVPARTEEIPRLVRLLALAHRWHRLIDSGEVGDQAGIAHAVGVTPARVSQIIDLRWLNPLVQCQLRPETLTTKSWGVAERMRYSRHWNDHAGPGGHAPG